MKGNTFQLIITIIFGAFAVIGVIFLGLQRSTPQDAINVEVWGVLDEDVFERVTGELFAGNNAVNISYEEFSRDDFDIELTEALAEDRGPDAILINEDQILTHQEKIIAIPYETFSLRDFKDTYIDGADIFTNEEGIIGFPLYVDPLVMYWNKNIFANAGLVSPPSYWDEFNTVVPDLTESDFNGTIQQAGVSFGEMRNVDNAKDVLSAMLIQAGTPIVERNSFGELENVLRERFGSTLVPAETALRFYTEFSDPVKPIYSWNRSLPRASRMFSSGDLAMYFGFASEIDDIRLVNPNLNFDVAPFPQIRSANTRMTLGHIGALSVLKRAQDPNGALALALILSERDAGELFVVNRNVAPVQRRLLREPADDAYKSVFYESAVIARSWLDPNPAGSRGIFQEMVEDVTSGRLRIGESVNRASDLMDILLGQ